MQKKFYVTETVDYGCGFLDCECCTHKTIYRATAEVADTVLKRCFGTEEEAEAWAAETANTLWVEAVSDEMQSRFDRLLA